jgi:hypothetical protein
MRLALGVTGALTLIMGILPERFIQFAGVVLYK